MTLEQLIFLLSRYGHMRVGQYSSINDDFHCSLDLFVPGVGITMSVASDYHGLPTATDAAAQCLERLKETITKLKGNGVNIDMPTVSMFASAKTLGGEP